MIKDSGNRTEFESGAVRDVQEGKGRFDLVPLNVISDMIFSIGDAPAFGTLAYTIFHLSLAQKELEECAPHDQIREDLYMALRSFSSYAFGIDAKQKSMKYLYANMLLEVAVHFEEGAKKYEENNWKKGIPLNRYFDSACRHLFKYIRGDSDERHDRAFAWNIMCMIWEITHGCKKENNKTEQSTDDILYDKNLEGDIEKLDALRFLFDSETNSAIKKQKEKDE